MLHRSKSFWLIVITLPILAGAAMVCATYWPTATGARPTPSLPRVSESLEANARSVIAVYCGGCHTSGRSGVDFDEATLQLSAMRRDRGTWELALQKLRSGTMPPRNFPQPGEEDREDLIRWIEQDVLKDDADANGPIMARRLLRSEYQHAVQDLLGVTLESDLELPADDRGWDRCKGVPVLAEEMREVYRTAAASILEEALLQELASIDPGCGPDDDEMPAEAVAPRAPHLFVCDVRGKSEAEHARGLIASFARKAYRRPVETAEIDRLAAVFASSVKEGANFEEGMRDALLEILTSPHFVYRLETRPTGDQTTTDAPMSQTHALASRLSFMLWSSPPDAELNGAADKGFNAATLDIQVRRLLKDPRSQALATDFAGHWLSLHKLDIAHDHDKPLTRAMRLESELFLANILREDRSVLEFLDSDYTFLNEKLAKHYGIPGVEGEHMRRVALSGSQRGGLLTQASFLKITSTSFDTSPVLRGKWVLENLLGAAPVRPPLAVIEALKDRPKSFEAGSARQQLAMHRANPSCYECHGKMDAIGLALENFDGSGAWRTNANNTPIEAIGDLPDGETLNGPKDLRDYLKRHQKQFVRGLSEKLLAYSLGRKLTDRDRAALEPIPDRVAADGYRFSRLLIEVTQSEPFRAGWNTDSR